MPNTETQNTGIITFYQGDKDKPGVQSYTFRIEIDNRKINGKDVSMPKKLGDGNFGMVFEAPSTTLGVGTYALKVLYEHQGIARGEEKERILEELQIGLELPKRLAEVVNHEKLEEHDKNFPKEGDRQSRWLALPKAYSTNFNDLVGREELEKQDVKFSEFAYIMEKFDKSLKDLVEEPIDNEEGGYGRLKRSTLEERERSAIPILDQISRGLQILHAAALRHQDIKPGNIYFKTEGTDIVFRLGDLGFLKPHDPALAGTVAASIDDTIGTKHYRSIEQIDFKDVAECDVKVKSDKKSATLVTRDPKFLATVMRKGDLAYFTKSNSRRLMRIDEICKYPDKGRVEIKVLHQVPPSGNKKDGNSENDPLVDDTKTQVSFFKNPSAKTDLFGIAGILFDILTVGESPERFYELLRRYDVEDVNIEDHILNRYATWEAGTLEDAGIGAIFSRVNRGIDRGQTVRKEVLAFLLKCMMSDASGSFYKRFGFEEAELDSDNPDDIDARLKAVGAWAKVIQKLDNIKKAIGAKDYIRHDTNVLTRSITDEPNKVPEHADSIPPPEMGENLQVGLSTVLSAYLKGEPPNPETEGHTPGTPNHHSLNGSTDEEDKRAFRWLMSGLLIMKMADTIETALESPPGSMRSLSPEHVSVKSHGIAARVPVVTTEERQIISSLRARDPLLTRIRPFSSRFEPIWWRYGTRRVRLSIASDSPPAESATNGQDSMVEAKFDFFDFSFAANSVEPGDFILPTDGPVPTVFRVKKVGKDNNSLELHIFIDDLEDENRRKEQLESARLVENAYLIKNPNAVDYYAGMLAIYLYHFLISDGVGQNAGITDFPSKVYDCIRKFPLRFKKIPSDGTKKGPPWEQLKGQTLRLITWLSLGGFAFDNEGEPIKEENKRWTSVHEEVRNWYETLNKHALQGGKIDNWDLIRNTPSSASRRGVKVKNFGEISPDDWKDICGTYIDSRKGVIRRYLSVLSYFEL